MSSFQVEEEADLGAASAGGGAHGHEPGNGVDGVFDGLGDEDLHLFDGHDAVVDADDDAGEVGLGKDGDGHLQGEVDAGESEDDGEEEDGLGVARQPEAGVCNSDGPLRGPDRDGWGRRTLVFVSSFGCRGLVFVRFFVVGGSDLYFGAVFQRVGAGGDYFLADLQALGDLRLVVLRDAEFDFAMLRCAVGGDDHDLLLAGGVGYDGSGGDYEGIGNGLDARR